VGGAGAVDAHTLTPDAVLAWVRQVGGPLGRIIVVGCEPATIEESMELSPPVTAAVDGAVDMIRALTLELRAEARAASVMPSGSAGSLSDAEQGRGQASVTPSGGGAPRVERAGGGAPASD
jgi:hydrogenase maturation protease